MVASCSIFMSFDIAEVLAKSSFQCLFCFTNVSSPFTFLTSDQIDHITCLTVMMFLNMDYFSCVYCVDGLAGFHIRTYFATFLAL